MMGVLIITSLYVSKLVGGMLYMCIQMSKFIAWLLVRHHPLILSYLWLHLYYLILRIRA